jgi:hypothetical protein
MDAQEMLSPSTKAQLAAQSHSQEWASSVDIYTTVAPVPITVAQTGLPVQLLKHLTLKHLFERTVVSTRELSDSMALAGAVIDELVQILRDEAMVEISSAGSYVGDLYFRLTDRGRLEAQVALTKSGYSGPAPVALEDYRRVVEHYSILKHPVTQAEVDELFNGFIIEHDLRNQVGTAMNSHRPIFIYGPAGTGKTYTIRKLSQLYSDDCLIPHAIASGEVIVQVYNAQLHKLRSPVTGEAQSLCYAEAYDKRYIPCERPVVIAGGELTLDQLEVRYAPETRLFQAPLQLQANNGLFIIDDMGRQAVPPKAIFNRWIVPMEERRDFLSLSNGQHFEAPFDLQLVFSSNIHPLELADEAFLRRIGFKIRFTYLSDAAYTDVWKQVLDEAGLAFEPVLIDYLINSLHRRHGVPLAPCHPRDLLNTALSQINYLSAEPVLTRELIDWAWHVYFVPLDPNVPEVGDNIIVD